jgi:hypothetical protein
MHRRFKAIREILASLDLEIATADTEKKAFELRLGDRFCGHSAERTDAGCGWLRNCQTRSGNESVPDIRRSYFSPVPTTIRCRVFEGMKSEGWTIY